MTGVCAECGYLCLSRVMRDVPCVSAVRLLCAARAVRHVLCAPAVRKVVVFCLMHAHFSSFGLTAQLIMLKIDTTVHASTKFSTWGCSSVGRALPPQGRGRGFDSLHLHHVFSSFLPPFTSANEKTRAWSHSNFSAIILSNIVQKPYFDTRLRLKIVQTCSTGHVVKQVNNRTTCGNAKRV